MEILLDGKNLAKEFSTRQKEKVVQLKEKGITPKLTAILVGDDPASAVYVRMKGKRCKKLGIDSETINLPTETTEAELLELIEKLNADKSVSGILTQLPLPNHINEETILESISPKKDVDCFHPTSVGKLTIGNPIFEPATPAGAIRLLERYDYDFSGKHAVIIGRSNIVGKPVSLMLLQKNCTVTICHSRTKNIDCVAKTADLLVVAIGRPKMINENWVKKGAWVVDVGTNRLEDGTLCGDVDFDAVKDIAHAISPSPGGVGPMTITMLMENTIKAAELIGK
ncbi:MAG: bifunctional methylenetetrahydrofolate dehydrogenase/methenyltetrahydrofolate cyclohydrolase FolD [Caldisericia bacterium]